MNDNALTILVVEDEDFISSLVAKSLKEEGYNVIITSDFKSSLIVLDTEAIDLVISDVMLPYTGGLDIVEYVRENENIEATPIILVTGMDTDVIASSNIKADAIIPKPFEMVELIEKVNELLGKKD